MKINYLYTLVIVVLCVKNTQGQDVHFSQSYNNVVNVNSSATAVLPYGIARVSAAYRTQWNAVPVPYSTLNFNGELAHNWLPLRNIQQGVGLTVYTDKAGDGNLKQTHVSLNNSFRKNVGDSTCYVSVGSSLGYHQWSFDESKLKFTSQFVGDQYSGSNTNNENFTKSSLRYLDINLGALVYKKVKRTQWLGGIALQHVNKPKQSFNGVKNVLSYKSIFTLQATQTLSNSVQLMLNQYSAFQGKYTEQITSMRVLKNIKIIDGVPFNVIGGVMYRWKDAPIVAFGVDYRRVHAELSYDINTSGLKQATGGRGATEFFISYIIQLQKIKIPTRTTCPVYI